MLLVSSIATSSQPEEDFCFCLLSELYQPITFEHSGNHVTHSPEDDLAFIIPLLLFAGFCYFRLEKLRMKGICKNRINGGEKKAGFSSLLVFVSRCASEGGVSSPFVCRYLFLSLEFFL